MSGDDERSIEGLIERSSFGTRDAKDARESVSPDVGRAVALASRYLGERRVVEQRLAAAEALLLAAYPHGIAEGPAAIHFCPVPGCNDCWESEASCQHAALIPEDDWRHRFYAVDDLDECGACGMRRDEECHL